MSYVCCLYPFVLLLTVELRLADEGSCYKSYVLQTARLYLRHPNLATAPLPPCLRGLTLASCVDLFSIILTYECRVLYCTFLIPNSRNVPSVAVAPSGRSRSSPVSASVTLPSPSLLDRSFRVRHSLGCSCLPRNN